jgi:transcriptional regulator with XRE-family HTH domain
MPDSTKINAFLGAKIKNRRILQGMSQLELGRAIGVTFQQIQKYEKGTNRVVFNKLIDLASALNVQVNYFFEGLDSILNNKDSNILAESAATYEGESNNLDNREVKLLIKYFSGINNSLIRKQILSLIKCLAQGTP